MKKTLILGLIVCSLLVVSIDSVTAADETQTIIDPEGDVTDLFGQYTDKKPNVDIIEVTYSKEENKVTLSLKVKGIIEKRGDINSLLDEDEGDFNVDMVAYMLIFISSNNSYIVTYVNDVCSISDDYTEFDTSSFSVIGNTLTVFFDLADADEIYHSLEATSFDWKLFSMYMDGTLEESSELEMDAGGPYEGLVGESINFSGIAVGGSFPYTWEWDLDGDGNVDSTEQTLTHTYETAGEYMATLTVTDDDGSTVTDTTTVTISADGDDNGTNGTNGNNGQSDSDDDSGLILFVALIAIISIVGIIILVYIIRR